MKEKVILEYIAFLVKKIYKSSDSDIIMKIIEEIDSCVNIQLDLIKEDEDYGED